MSTQHTGSDDARLQPLVVAYTASALEGDRAQAQQIVTSAMDQGVSLHEIYLKLFQPSLYQIGHLWATGKVSIAQEHLATAVTQAVLGAVYARVDLPTSLSQHAVVACLSGNYHEIGPRMVADFLQLEGYNTRFLGANTPIEAVIELVDRLRPAVVGLPATTAEQIAPVRAAIEQLRAEFVTYRPVVMVGGQAFNLGTGLWQDVAADVWGPDGAQAIQRLTTG
jgi:MerR family transcriptional regulator, light-induced transcriptional regulator